MLNKFKIGAKLMGGFLLVLALLGIVAFAGWYGLQLSSKNTSEMLNLEDLQTEAMRLRRNVCEAIIASMSGTASQDSSFLQVSEGISQDVNKIAEEIHNRLLPENQKRMEDFKAKFEGLMNNDREWYRLDDERKELLDKFAANGELAVEQLKQCATQYRKALEVEGADGYVEQNGRRYYSSRIAEQVFDIEHRMADMQLLRRQYYQLVTANGIEARMDVLKTINEGVAELIGKLETFKGSVNNPERKQLMDEAQKAVEAWKADFDGITQIMKSQDELDVKSVGDLKDPNIKGLTDEMQDIMAEMMDQLRGRTGEIRESAASSDRNIIAAIIVIAIVAFIAGLIIALLLSRNITKGIAKAVGALNLLAHEGDISFEIPADDLRRADEIGDLAKAAGSILNDYQNIGAMAESLANGDWCVEIKEKSQADAMNQNLNRMLGQVNSALSEINESVKQVNTGAGEVSSASQTLSSGAQESAASLEEITASMSEISSQTKSNAESAGQARDLAQSATKAATEGQEAMQEMTGAMDRITQNSNEIQRVIKVIDDIAFQTNLLALNAAVEAARAGVHGKGFAVVAEEVRNLAARSAKAAQETTELISKSGQEISNGGSVASRTSEVLNAIADQIKQTTDLVAGIAVASNEQAQGVAQITVGLQQIDAVTQQNTAAAEESASAANEMSGMASTLQQLVAKFKLKN